MLRTRSTLRGRRSAPREDDPDLSAHLTNLSLLLTQRHQHFGIGLEDAVWLGERAVATARDDQQRRRAPSDLSTTLLGQELAVDAARDALAMTPPGHPERAAVLSNLGSALRARQEIDGAVAVLRAAVATAAPHAGPADTHRRRSSAASGPAPCRAGRCYDGRGPARAVRDSGRSRTSSPGQLVRPWPCPRRHGPRQPELMVGHRPAILGR